jgi:flagellar biosynthetic protein FliP
MSPSSRKRHPRTRTIVASAYSRLVLILTVALGLVPGAQAGPFPAASMIPKDMLAASSASSASAATSPSPIGSVIDLNPLAMLDDAAQLLPGGAAAPSSALASDASANGTTPRRGLSTAINILLLLTVITLAPSIVLMTTCFMRILIVLGFLKQAIGAQSIPPPQVTTALALFMTAFVMTPTVERVYNEAIVPYRNGEVSDYDVMWAKCKQPIRDFMFAQIEATNNWSSLYTMLEYRGHDTSSPEKLSRADVDMPTLITGFMLSELKSAFLMGFRVYLPFLVIDMVVSTMLISMSMMMLPPVLISLPFKVLLFVLVDGWALVVGNLMSSFAAPVSQAWHAASALPIFT